jgi:SlyX protein
MIPDDNTDEQFNKLMIDLQTKLTYQEDTVQALNDIVSEQQQDILQLKAQVHSLIDELRTVLSGLDTSGINPEQEVPPHY